jgi:hypothetical protein
VKTEAELEREINEIAVLYSSITGENVEVLKETEQLKLFNRVFEYCKKYMYKKRKDELGFTEADNHALEIYNCVKTCSENYKPESGEFLRYFKRSIKFAIRTVINKGIMDTTGNENYLSEISEKEFNDIESNMPKPGEKFFLAIETEELLDAVEAVFCQKQDRVKPYLRALLTVELYDAIIQFNFRKHYSFVDMSIIKTALRNRGQVPLQKEIAKSFGKEHETDASRTIHKFFKKLKDNSVVRKRAILKGAITPLSKFPRKA